MKGTRVFTLCLIVAIGLVVPYINPDVGAVVRPLSIGLFLVLFWLFNRNRGIASDEVESLNLTQRSLSDEPRPARDADARTS